MTRRLVVTEFLTLDGVMQGPGSADEDREGGFTQGGWHVPFVDDEQMKAASEGMAATDAYLFGRKTYEIMAAHWPDQPESDPFAKALNSVPKYVVSTTLREPLAWAGSTLIDREVPTAIADLKEGPGRNIAVLGSGELVRSLLRDGLVDEIDLMIDPIVLGSGKRLFDDGLSPERFDLLSSMTTAKGVIVAAYQAIPV